jgi:23S rRNA (cytosine1962-C5)-methyltransferase
VPDPSALENKLRKNAQHLRKWAKGEDVTAWRVYDRDMPDWPFAVDWYDGRVQFTEYPSRRALKSGEAEAMPAAAQDAVQRALESPPSARS